jgi:hypothetical protein
MIERGGHARYVRISGVGGVALGVANDTVHLPRRVVKR